MKSAVMKMDFLHMLQMTPILSKNINGVARN